MEKNFKEKDLQLLIGNLLRGGVIVSMTIVILGLILYFIQNGNQMVQFDAFQEDHAFQFTRFFQELKSFRGQAFITLGVICLILTPVLRIIFAIIGFKLENDLFYVLISSIVLLIILSSIFLGAVD